MPMIAAADGTQLFYRDWGGGGAGGSSPVVMIHGWPLSGDAWSAQAVALARAGHRVLAYDRRGFGRSDQPWTGYDYDTLSDDLDAIIRGLDLRNVALVGFSMGGGEIIRYAARHGIERLSKAVFVGSVAPGLPQSEANPKGAPGSVFDGMKEGIEKDRAAFFEDFFPSFYGQKTRGGGVSDAVLRWSWGMAMQASLKATLDCVDAFGRTDFTADAAALRLPVLAIHGTGDATVPIEATAHRLVKLVPAAELIEYDGAPHGLPASHQDRLTADLLAFLR